MTTNETVQLKREILSFNKKILKGLNKLFDFDFNNEYSIMKLDNGFTVKKIEKLINDDINDYKIVILLKTNYYKSLNVVLLENEKFSIDVSCNANIGDYGMCRIYTKKEFEELRKTNHGSNYIIFQKKNLLKQSKPQENRKNYLIDRYAIDRITAYKAELINKTLNKETSFYLDVRIKECDVLDKSGYLKFEFNNNLKSRLSIYKKRKREKEISDFDFSIYEDDVLSEIKKCKNTICEKLNIIDIEDREFRFVLNSLKSCNISFETFNRILEFKRNNFFTRIDLNKDDILKRLENIKKEVIEIENKINAI